MKSLLKWAGAKNWLVENYSHLLPDPSTITGYREPFVGSGAVAKHYLGHVPCALSDANNRLVKMYRGVKESPEEVIGWLKQLPYELVQYHAVRAMFNGGDALSVPDHRVAAWFIYLNRCGFNGLYRENRKGDFNVPFGRYTNPTICDEDTIRAWSKALKGATLLHADWRDALNQATTGEFAFIDPPYVPASETANFTGYVAGGFGPRDQERLGAALHHLDERGVKWMLTNSAEAKSLYYGWNVLEVDVKRSISCKGWKRLASGEVIVTNYSVVPQTKAQRTGEAA